MILTEKETTILKDLQTQENAWTIITSAPALQKTAA